MLEEPQNINEADNESIKELISSYPYFVPARYMQAAQQHQEKAFDPNMLSGMQLFSGNWYFYNEYLQAAIGGAETEFTATITEGELVAEESEVATDESNIEDTQVVEPDKTDDTTAEEKVEDKQEEPVFTGFIRGRKNKKKEEVAPKIEEESVKEEVVENTVETETPTKATDNEPKDSSESDSKNDNLIPPVYTEDYFLHQGVRVSNELPDDIGESEHKSELSDTEEQSLMVVMSFSEWLVYYKKKKQQEEEEEEDQRALRSMWQKEKLASALEEENEEIPETVFEMAVNSIANEEDLASESLAEVMVRQGRYDKAIDMYKKLSLRKPQKKAYFARKIEDILKEK